MGRVTGTYRVTRVGGEEVRAFVPRGLGPKNPGMMIEGELERVLGESMAALSRLSLAGAMVASPDWFLYGFVRKEAVISSQIEGTQATLRDVVTFEATESARDPADVSEVCNYVEALNYARRQLADPKGLGLSTRLLCEAHRRLMKGVRGAEKGPGEIRRSQNWVGGTRPGNAVFVPPPPELVPGVVAELEKWIHGRDPLPPLVRAGLAHVQFETIHPFLDGNGRIGRLLIALLLEHWGLLPGPLLYLSLAFKRRQAEYYQRLSAVRTDGDWEGWTAFFLRCVREAADDGVAVAQRLFTLLASDRRAVVQHQAATVVAIRLFDELPTHPVLTLGRAVELTESSKPTASKAIDVLLRAGVVRETTGRQRDRVYIYQKYLDALTTDD